MYWIKKLTLLVTLFMVGMLLLAACGAEEPTPVVVEEVVDTQATAEAEAAIAADKINLKNISGRNRILKN